MFGAPRFSTTLAATALLAAVAVLVMMAGMDQSAPGGDVAYASDPQAGLAATGVEAKTAAREAMAVARAARVEPGEAVAVRTAAELTTKAIDLPAVQDYCRTVDYNYSDCVNAHIVVDGLRGDCADCRDLSIWIFHNQNGRVTHLSKTRNEFSRDFGSLENMGLAGVIPREIGNLPYLEMFDVGNSSLGDGPANQLTGTIPGTLGGLRDLTWLALDSNRLHWSIPWNLGNLRDLEHLYLFNNQLSGSIPQHLSNLRNLTHLALSNNRLGGSIPYSLRHLSNLEHLSLSSNELSGAIPPVLGDLSNLTHLALSSNRLSYPIPSELGKLTKLEWLVLDNNRLTGSIPSELGRLTKLEYLSLDSNRLTGCVPASLREAYEEADGDDYPICQSSTPTPTPTATPRPPATPTPTPTATRRPPATPTPTPTTAARQGTCGAAVPDRSNTGLVSDCEALLAARDTLRGTAALNWAPNTPIGGWDGITLGGSPQRVIKLKLNSQEKRLDGHIPAEIGEMAMLEELWLHNNRLSGTLPSELGDLGNLSWLFMSNNRLSGQIPQNLNKLKLDRFWIHKNSFTGCVPYNLTLTREYRADRGLPACAPPGTGPSPTPTPGATPTPVPTAQPDNTDARLTAIEGRLADLERRVASLEATVSGLTGQTRLTR